MTEPMNPAEIAAMVADMQAGTLGPWYVDVLPETDDINGTRIKSPFQTVSGDSSWDTEITEVNCCCCGTGGIATMEDARRIARVPAMEQTILALQAQLAAMTKARDAAVARVGVLEAALQSLMDLNDNYAPFGGELYRDRVDRTWDAARAARAATTDKEPT